MTLKKKLVCAECFLRLKQIFKLENKKRNENLKVFFIFISFMYRKSLKNKIKKKTLNYLKEEQNVFRVVFGFIREYPIRSILYVFILMLKFVSNLYKKKQQQPFTPLIMHILCSNALGIRIS